MRLNRNLKPRSEEVYDNETDTEELVIVEEIASGQDTTSRHELEQSSPPPNTKKTKKSLFADPELETRSESPETVGSSTEVEVDFSAIELPHALSPNGLADELVKRLKESMPRRVSHARAAIYHLRLEAAGIVMEWASLPSWVKVYANDQSSIIDVLRYCLRRETGLSIADGLATAARKAYGRVPRICDRVFGDLLPEFSEYLSTVQKQEIAARRRANYTANKNNTLSDDLDVVMEILEKRAAEPRMGLKTGIAAFDRHTPGGLTQPMLLHGWTGVGKSAFAMELMLRTLVENPTVGGLVITTEVSKTWQFFRLLGREIRVSATDLASLATEQRIAARRSFEDTYKPRILIVGLDSREGGGYPISQAKGR